MGERWYYYANTQGGGGAVRGGADRPSLTGGFDE